jgi:hypothetical protein
LIMHTMGSSEQPIIRDLFLRKAVALKGLAAPAEASCTHRYGRANSHCQKTLYGLRETKV